MKQKSFIIATALLVGCSLSYGAADKAPAAEAAPAPASADAKQEPKAEEKKMSEEEVAKTVGYIFGYQTGVNMARSGPIKVEDINKEAFMEGIAAGLKGDKPNVEDTNAQAAFAAYETIIGKRVEELNAKNLEAGKKFLEEIAKQEGIVKTESGLMYKVLEKGGDKKYEAPKGEGPDQETIFKVKYKGTLPTGEVFDETGGEAVDMPLQVIKGFEEALTNMPIGARWMVYVPAELGYGERSPGGIIGPNQTLVFDLELVDIVKPDPNAPKQPAITPEQLKALMESQMGGQ